MALLYSISAIFCLFCSSIFLLWKKKLDGKIQGEIQQVDLFKNGFLQMIFSTEKTVWVLDRNGNVVPPFPLYYKNNITPVEVFDYDQNREYRFLFAENQTLHLLDRKGQPVKEVFQKDIGYFGWIQNADFPLYTKKILTAIQLRSKF